MLTPAVHLAVLLAVLLTVLLAAQAGPVQARRHRKPPKVEYIRVGIHHPHPALCPGDDLSQRDLRVLRLAFDIGGSPSDWRTRPWFYAVPRTKRGNKGAPAPEGLRLVLNTRALWGVDWRRQPGGSDPATAGLPGRLSAWRDGTVSRLNGAPAEEEANPAVLVLSPDQPFLSTLLTQSRNLPYLAAPPAPEAAPRPAPGFPFCRNWPRGIVFDTSGNDPEAPNGASAARLSYAMYGPPARRGKPFLLLAYKEESRMWGEYLAGELDALFLEKTAYQSRLKHLDDDVLGPWGMLPGGQQIVLRISPALLERITPEERKILSIALNRKDLSDVGEDGRFHPLLGFLEPLLDYKYLRKQTDFVWDSREARRGWLTRRKKLENLRLGVLDHPLLVQMADRIQAHWNRTINQSVDVVTFSMDQYQVALESWEADMMLDVVDLDNGSLQALWMQALGLRPDPEKAPGTAEKAKRKPRRGSPWSKARILRWEATLRKELPYFPLAINRHLVLFRKDPPRPLFWRLCPNCRRIPSPMILNKPKAPPPNREG